MLFENEIRPGVLQLTIQKICMLQENQRIIHVGFALHWVSMEIDLWQV